MRICMFTNTYLPHVGGVARSVEILSNDLEKMGHDLLIVAPDFTDTGHQDTNKQVVRLPAIQNFNGSDFSVIVPIPFVLQEAVSEFQPDIIHSHHPFLLGDSALRAARNFQLPIVFTHHTLYEQYTHYVPFDSDMMKRFIIQLTTQYANMCDQVIAPSQSIADLIIHRGIKRPVTEIPTGVDVDFFTNGEGQAFRDAVGIPADAVVIGHVGRLAPEKNLAYLARAVSQYLQTDQNVHFLVVGDGPSRKEMEDIFKADEVLARVVFAGQKAGTQLRDAYNAMNLFVFSSKSETQGMVLAEAMAAGLPVVALDASGSREVVIDGQNGRLLSEDATIDDFSEAITSLIGNNTLLHYAESAKETAQQFSRSICARKVIGLYENAIQHYSTEKDKEPIDIVAWEKFLDRINTEWTLLTEKTRAIVDAVMPVKR